MLNPRLKRRAARNSAPRRTVGAPTAPLNPPFSKPRPPRRSVRLTARLITKPQPTLSPLGRQGTVRFEVRQPLERRVANEPCALRGIVSVLKLGKTSAVLPQPLVTELARQTPRRPVPHPLNGTRLIVVVVARLLVTPPPAGLTAS